MSVTVNVVGKGVDSSSGYVAYVDFTGPASYTTGGETLSAADVNKMLPHLGGGATVASGLASINMFQSETGPGGHSLGLDRANAKMLFFIGPQVAGSTNLGTITVRARINYGRANVG